MENKVTLNPDKLTFVEIMTLMDALTTGQLASMYDLAQKAVVSWSYPYDINEAGAILKLGIVESGKVINTVVTTLGDYVERVASSNGANDVVVDWNGIERDGVKVAWDTMSFVKWADLERAKKWKQAEAMMIQVADLNGSTLPLKATEGLLMKTAIQQAYADAIQGKG